MIDQVSQSASILVVDDDREILGLISDFLRKHGFSIDTAERTAEAEKKIQARHVDLMILDVMMPEEDGLAFCRRIRVDSRIPIIMLTALGEETDRIVGLELGADDYLPKPFNPRELLARVKAVLRRTHLDHNSNSPSAQGAKSSSTRDSSSPSQERKLVLFDQWRLDLARRELQTKDEVLTSLTSGEYELLVAFIEHPQRVLNRDQLLDITRGRSAGPFDRSIDVQLSRLRKKIEINPKEPVIIKTVRNGGYIFTPEVSYQ